MVSINDQVRAALETVHDPELPTVRIVDLGIVEDVRVSDAAIEIDLLPTFAGCPALDLIQKDVEDAVVGVSEGRDVRVKFLTRAWTTDRISKTGHESLIEFGVAPPVAQTRCPNCGSSNTTVESSYGPTLCRDIRYCNDCHNPFEGFKRK
ncbi:MAG: 1,2-phenylacetyl-CoA epoxidase subunit PaaD [Actinomycetota bacterium]